MNNYVSAGPVKTGTINQQAAQKNSRDSYNDTGDDSCYVQCESESESESESKPDGQASMHMTIDSDHMVSARRNDSISDEPSRFQLFFTLLVVAAEIALLWPRGSRPSQLHGVGNIPDPAGPDLPTPIYDAIHNPVYQEKYLINTDQPSFASLAQEQPHPHYEPGTSDTKPYARYDREAGLISAMNRGKRSAPNMQAVSRDADTPMARAVNWEINSEKYAQTTRKLLGTHWIKAIDNQFVTWAAQDTKETMRYLAFIEENMQFLQNKAQKNEFDQIYKEVRSALHEFIELSQSSIFNPNTKIVDDFFADRRGEKWSNYQTSKQLKLTDDDLYIQSKYTSWQQQGIRSTENVAIRLDGFIHFFSLSDLLKKKHSRLKGYKNASYTFRFDTSGLFDAELEEFAHSEHRQAFSQFTNSSEFFKLKAGNLWEQTLQKTRNHPLGFSKAAEIQNLISTNSVLENKQHGLIEALIKLALEMPAQTRDILTHTAFAYAHSLVMQDDSGAFEGINLEQVLTTDYVISYEDELGVRRYETVSFIELLHKNSAAPYIHISQRNSIVEYWPDTLTLNRKFMTFLANTREKTTKFTARLTLAAQINKEAEELAKKVGSFNTMLQNILTSLCRNSGVTSCRLSDKLVFEYEAPSELVNNLEKFPVNQKFFLEAVHDLTKIGDRHYQQSFTYAEILQGKQRRWETAHSTAKMTAVYKDTTDHSETPTSTFLTRLQNADAEKMLITKLQRIENDSNIKRHFNQHQHSLMAQRNSRQSNNALYEFSATPLLAVFLNRSLTPTEKLSIVNAPREFRSNLQDRQSQQYEKLQIPITVISRATGEVLEFESVAAMKEKIRKGPDLATFFKGHLPVDFGDNLDLLRLNEVTPLDAKNLFKRTMRWHQTNIDKMIRSPHESLIDNITEALLDESMILMLPAFTMGPIAGLAYGIAVFVGPRLLLAYNSDTRQEREEHLLEAATALAMEAGGTVAGEALAGMAASLKNGFKNAFGVAKKEISIMRERGDASDNLFKELEQKKDFHVDCPTRVKREGGTITCTISRIAGNSAETPLASRTGTGRLEPLFRKIKNIFGDNTKQLLTKYPKTIALEKLAAAKDVVTDPAYAESVNIAAKALLGEHFDAAVFVTQTEKLADGIKALTPAKINVLKKFNNEDQTIARVNNMEFQKDGAFLEVNHKGLRAYYQHMGESPNALADLLIHEMSHPILKTMDYVYIGSRALKNGEVDVFELTNLANNNLEFEFSAQHGRNIYVSPLSGKDLAHLIRNSAQSKTAGLKNADSLTQFISLLAKKKNKNANIRAEFEREIKQLSDLYNVSNERIAGPVTLKRSRRVAPAANPQQLRLQDIDPKELGDTARYILTIDRTSNQINVYALSNMTIDTAKQEEQHGKRRNIVRFRTQVQHQSKSQRQ